MTRLVRAAVWVAIALAAILGLALVSFFAFPAQRERVMGMRPPRARVVRPPADAELSSLRDVAFRTADGLALRAWYAPSANGAAIVLAHGYAGNRMQFVNEARLLVRAGYGVLLFDFRGQGESEGDRIGIGDPARRDVRAAIAFAASQPDVNADRLGIVGFSAGAAPVAQVAADDPRIRAVALEGSAASLESAMRHHRGRLGRLWVGPVLLLLRAAGIDVDATRADTAVPRIAPRPLLLVHGDQEPDSVQMGMRTLYAKAHMPKRLLIVRGAGHGHYAKAPEGEVYERELLALFNGALTQTGR